MLWLPQPSGWHQAGPAAQALRSPGHIEKAQVLLPGHRGERGQGVRNGVGVARGEEVTGERWQGQYNY